MIRAVLKRRGGDLILLGITPETLHRELRKTGVEIPEFPDPQPGEEQRIV
jgi:hypothetical protein